ncbi:MAG TPA: ankyrin repeat domain-containing protein [Puia sp.]|nr:ankyrin repeat domain-containing protein [Puia sp.]
MSKQLETGASPNAVSGEYSALMATSLYGTVDQMKILIDRGANVNFLNKDSITALWMAVPDWDKSILLLNHGANPNFHSKEGYTVLYKLVIYPGTGPLLKKILDMGVDPNKETKTILLFSAVQSCDTNVVSQLLSKGLNPNDSTFFGEYPINSALNYRCSDVVKLLVDHGADVNACPKHFKNKFLNGITPLMNAAISNDKESVLYLLNHGADPNIKSQKGFTALMFLEQNEYDNPELTKILIEHGATVSNKAMDGTDALFYAMKKGNTASAEIIRNNMH